MLRRRRQPNLSFCKSNLRNGSVTGAVFGQTLNSGDVLLRNRVFGQSEYWNFPVSCVPVSRPFKCWSE